MDFIRIQLIHSYQMMDLMNKYYDNDNDDMIIIMIMMTSILIHSFNTNSYFTNGFI